jgi:uncharacterized damage-inducible protein DinB
MTVVDSLRRLSGLAHQEMVEAVEGVSEGQSWAVLPNNGPDYLHSDGSIHAIALHVATCKVMYASAGFKGTEIRWRDLAEKVASFEPSWQRAVEYLHEAQRYWLESWSDLEDDDLQREIQHPQGAMMPAIEIIALMTLHDSYHAGQIVMLRYGVAETDLHPPSAAEDIRVHCADSVSW